MPEKWTGRLIGKMHNNGVTYDQLAQRLGVGKAYLSLILNGKRNPPNVQQRLETALNEILAERKD